MTAFQSAYSGNARGNDREMTLKGDWRASRSVGITCRQSRRDSPDRPVTVYLPPSYDKEQNRAIRYLLFARFVYE